MTHLYLHIGSHKTGTTAIQVACRDKTITGMHYIDIRPDPDTDKEALFAIRAGKNGPAKLRLKFDAVEQVFVPKSGEGKIVSSSEAFFALDDQSDIERLGAVLKSKFDDVTIIVYLRRQDRHAVSHRKQYAGGQTIARLHGVDTMPLPQISNEILAYYDYAEKLSKWTKAFGKKNIVVVSYDDVVRNNEDVVDHFAKVLGLKCKQVGEVRRNTSKGSSATYAGLIMQQLNLSQRTRKEVSKLLEGEDKFLPSKSEAETFLNQFQNSNERLQTEWQFEGAPIAFDDDFSSYPEVPDGCRTLDGREEIIRTLLSHIDNQHKRQSRKKNKRQPRNKYKRQSLKENKGQLPQGNRTKRLFLKIAQKLSRALKDA
jgi:hypothetical protein